LRISPLRKFYTDRFSAILSTYSQLVTRALPAMPNKPLIQAVQTRLIDNVPLVVIFLLISDSLHFVFARLLLPYLPPTTSSMYVLGIATVEMAIFAAVWFFLTIGFLVAASTALTYVSVVFIDPGTASLLSKTAVLFGLGFGIIWLRDRLTTFESIGALAALAGTSIITFQPGDYLHLGSLIVIASAFMYALHTALVKRQDGDMSLVEFFLFRLACTTGFLFLFAASRGELVRPPAWQAWLLLILTGTVDVTVSRGLYYLALRRLTLSHHSLILTLSPIASIVWTLLLFGVSPTVQQLIGGVAILAGVLMVTVGRERVMSKA
jgi:drug/metabolite transporter (DMT)-like permease